MLIPNITLFFRIFWSSAIAQPLKFATFCTDLACLHHWYLRQLTLKALLLSQPHSERWAQFSIFSCFGSSSATSVDIWPMKASNFRGCAIAEDQKFRKNNELFGKNYMIFETFSPVGHKSVFMCRETSHTSSKMWKNRSKFYKNMILSLYFLISAHCAIFLMSMFHCLLAEIRG